MSRARVSRMRVLGLLSGVLSALCCSFTAHAKDVYVQSAGQDVGQLLSIAKNDGAYRIAVLTEKGYLIYLSSGGEISFMSVVYPTNDCSGQPYTYMYESPITKMVGRAGNSTYSIAVEAQVERLELASQLVWNGECQAAIQSYRVPVYPIIANDPEVTGVAADGRYALPLTLDAR